MFFGSSNQIGVSIGSSSIKVAELKKSRNGYELTHFGMAPLPEGVIINREIMNPGLVVDVLRGLVSQLKIKGKDIVTSLSGAGVIIKRISLDPVPAKELEDALLWEAEQYIPFDINEVIFDYHVVNKSNAEGKMDVLLVAAKKQMVESYFAVLKEAGLQVKTCNVDVLAIQDVYERNYSDSENTVALADIGAVSTKFSICQAGAPAFTRDSAVGGRDLTTEIQRHLNISFEEAEILKVDGSGHGQVPQEVNDLIRVACENIAAEIKRSIDFYVASHHGAPLSYLLLAGGGSRLPELGKIVEDAIGIPVQILNPFQSVGYDESIFTTDYLNNVSAIAAIPMGLALRGFEK